MSTEEDIGAYDVSLAMDREVTQSLALLKCFATAMRNPACLTGGLRLNLDLTAWCESMQLNLLVIIV